MKQKLHICQDIEGALNNWSKKTWDAMGRDNGITGNQVKEKFRIYLHEGMKVLPIGKECEGFSYQTGCPGHEIEDEESEGK